MGASGCCSFIDDQAINNRHNRKDQSGYTVIGEVRKLPVKVPD